MKFTVPVLATVMLLLFGAGSICADVTLTNGNSTALINPASTSGMYQWTVDGVNQLYQEWFWYRVGATGGESGINALGTATITDESANAVTIQYGAAASLNVSVTFTLIGGSSGSHTADVAETIIVRNGGLSPVDLHFFEYADFDLNGTPAGQTVTFPNNYVVDQSGVGAVLSETVTTPAASSHEAGIYSNTLNELNDGSPTTLNGVSSAGPGDATWAFEWDRTVAAGGSFIISKDKNLASVVPEPASILGLGTVLLLVGARLRRKKTQA
jgi:hypothetical protein